MAPATAARMTRLVILALCALGVDAVRAQSASAPDAAPRQSLDDAWWTGPILAASASTLPQGHFLVEPYVFDAISHGRFDSDGERRNTSDVHSLGSLTYILYGVTDRISAGVIPTFAFNDVSNGPDSSGVRVGDLTLQAQYRLAQFQEGRRVPTVSFVVQQVLPTGKYDELGDRPSDGVGSGVYATTLALFSQYYFWAPTGRILRTRLNASYTFAGEADVQGVSVYGTDDSFRGRAHPGDSFSIIAAGEYSVTRNWVLALDVVYERNARTIVEGMTTDAGNQPIAVRDVFPSGWRVGLAPAIEYNFNARVGVIAGARWFAVGENSGASITPVAAINMVF